MAGADTKNEETAHEEALDAFRAASEAEHENREEALDDLKFARLGEQWPENIKRDRDLDNRPCLTINRLPAFIRQVVNDARQNKPAITVHPVDSAADPATADVLSDLMRQIERSSDAEVAYDTALDFAVTGGFGYFKIDTRYTCDDTFEQDLVIERVSNPFSIFGDPSSTAADSSDWNRAFEISGLGKAAWEARWPDHEPVSWEALGAGQTFHAGDDELMTYAADWKREKATRQIVALSDGQVVDLAIYKAQKAMFDALGVSVVGQTRDVETYAVTQTLRSGAEVLETVKWAGKFIPLIPVFGEELNVEGRRVLRSMVRDAKDPQRMFNYWRTTSTELVALAPKTPFIGRRGQFESDAGKWATANTQTWAYIEYDVPEGTLDSGPPQRQPFAGPPAGALQEALNASDDMKAIMGLYDASLGAKSNETSGKAILARQREGDVSSFAYIDNLNRALRHAGRVLLDLIPKVYSTPRIIRVLGADNTARMVQVNGPAPDPGTGEQPTAPGADGRQQAIARIFDLTVGKYDVTVEAGPSFTTRREEAANQMIELIRAYPAAAPVIGDLLAKNLDWPGADEVAKRLQAMLPPQAQGGDPHMQAAQAQVQQLAKALGEAKAQLQAAQMDRSLDGRKIEVDAFNAETNRIKAVIGKDGAGASTQDLMPIVVQCLRLAAADPDLMAQITGGTSAPGAEAGPVTAS